MYDRGCLLYSGIGKQALFVLVIILRLVSALLHVASLDPVALCYARRVVLCKLSTLIRDSGSEVELVELGPLSLSLSHAPQGKLSHSDQLLLYKIKFLR